MKKFYALSLLLVAGLSYGQSVVITTVVDGTLSADGCTATTGGTSSPKIVELYVSGTVNFTGYKIQTESNGGATETWAPATANLDALGTVTNSFVYLVNVNSGTTSALFSELYPSITSNLIISSAMPNGNGNDAYRIVNATDVVIDQFGTPTQITGSSDYSAPWAYQDSYARRNNGVAPNAGTFVASTFTYGGNSAFVAPNNTCAFLTNAIQLGSYSATGGNKDFDIIAGLKMFPNPLTGNVLNITSNSNADKTVAVFDVLGKQVLSAKVTEGTVNVAALTSGVYIVKITEEGKTATRKLVVK